ncbi:MAG: PVC-type heme-binding CxxCH protein [Planctomycetaceae bacterium]
MPSTLAERPIAVARDERGRLYVTDSGGMTERAEKQLEEKPHRIRQLTDTDGDGVYDQSTLFADRMMFPEGCLWFRGSLYVAAPPEIWKLTDTNDDGVCDQREVWFDGTTLTGCGNDLHGPYAGLDGRLYWCKGAFAEQKHTLSDGAQLVTQSSHIFRAKPDGTQMENVLTGGMDNPVNVAFLRNGERFLSCTFFQFPEAGRRDGLIHAIYGGVYGKKHSSIYAHPMTGDVMPVLNHQGAAAPCGLIAGSDQLFGGKHDQQLFACYFNLHKVVQHRLIPNGPTYRTEDTDLLSCDHPDFHPTDVFEDADGSLLVVDTGGWYKVCCPTSQLAKPDVLGAVYRVRRKGQPVVAEALGQNVAWDSVDEKSLVGLLGDSRLFVQRRAADVLRLKGQPAVPFLADALLNHSSAAVRLRAVWVLAGIDHASAGQAATAALEDTDVDVRQAAAHVVGLHREATALPRLLDVANGPEAGPARAAMEAIGRLRSTSAVPEIMEVLASAKASEIAPGGEPLDDAARIVEHAGIFALIETAGVSETRAGLQSDSPAVLRATMVALDQMRGGDLKPEDVIPHMAHPDRRIRATAAWIVNHHPDWGGALSKYFGSRLASLNSLSGDEQTQLQELLANLATAPEIQSLLTSGLTPDSRPELRRFVLRTLAQTGLSSTPAAWLDALAMLAADDDAEMLTLVVTAARHLPQPKDGHPGLRQALAHVGSNDALSAELRLSAIDAAGNGLQLDDKTFEVLRRSLNPELPLDQRSIAANRLAGSVLSEAQVFTLVESLGTVGAMELPKLLPAFEQHASESQGTRLIDALKSSPGFRGLRVDLIKPVFAKYPASVQATSQTLVRMLNASIEEQTAQLEQLLKSLPDGDVRRGHEVFMSRKAACNTCHKLGYGGGRLGPDLTNIGKARNRRDLLEAIVFPSASIVRGYEPIAAELEDGRVVAGIVTGENQSEIVVSQDAVKSVHIARRDVVQILPSNVSPMPNGLLTLLSPQEIADLVAFLQSDQR